MSKEVCAPNFAGHTVDGEPENEKPTRASRKKAEPTPDVEEDT